ncbi:putative ORFan [Cotonvirus japonicus]|uniref:ORFan n=1 Tax=Cotonvirus japonicus TaxID=2811091 RepID=A0ABM7NS09_9VIRU|nr:putative ORFan [Cotonvirus japonicus]BCS82945.1 putative ORFan [Cotonvirus japonicus]
MITQRNPNLNQNLLMKKILTLQTKRKITKRINQNQNLKILMKNQKRKMLRRMIKRMIKRILRKIFQRNQVIILMLMIVNQKNLMLNHQRILNKQNLLKIQKNLILIVNQKTMNLILIKNQKVNPIKLQIKNQLKNPQKMMILKSQKMTIPMSNQKMNLKKDRTTNLKRK